MKFFNKKGFTLAELIVAVTISAILLIIVFKFVADTVSILSDSTRKSKILVAFYEFVVGFDGFKNNLPVGTVVKDYMQGYGYDVVMLKSYQNNEKGVLFGVIDKETMMLDKNSNYSQFGKKVIGYKELNQSDILKIIADPDTVYNYTFYEDKSFPSPVIKDFQMDFYNSGTIIDMNVGFVLSETATTNNWNEILPSDIYRVNLNF